MTNIYNESIMCKNFFITCNKCTYNKWNAYNK